MDPTLQADYEAQARVVKAMAHPTRLFIVDMLSRGGERCVCDLTARIGVDVSTVSKHLSLLKGAGIVEDDKRGNMVFYRLAMPCVVDFLECVHSLMRVDARSRTRVRRGDERSRDFKACEHCSRGG